MKWLQVIPEWQIAIMKMTLSQNEMAPSHSGMANRHNDSAILNV
jgi:hypothetical protein